MGCSRVRVTVPRPLRGQTPHRGFFSPGPTPAFPAPRLRMSGPKPPPTVGVRVAVFPQTRLGVRVGGGAAGTRDTSHGGRHGRREGAAQPV